MTITCSEALRDRAADLASAGFNGMDFAHVAIKTVGGVQQAVVEVHFHNNKQLANIAADFPGSGTKPIVHMTGGARIAAGDDPGQVQVQAVAHPRAGVLRLVVAPVGDYSTYTLHVEYPHIDPLLAELALKFRPGCFSVECAPDTTVAGATPAEPDIDYLAKDYESFRHALMAHMQDRVPGWQPTSEADLDQVLIDLFAAVGDELSDFQDRVMNEAYLGTARKRVSLARHARLMDYHIDQGNQATTWLALKVNKVPTATDLPDIEAACKDAAGVSVDQAGAELAKAFTVFTGSADSNADSQHFVLKEHVPLDPIVNELSFYTWGGVRRALAAGSTYADLSVADEGAANSLVTKITSGELPRLLIQEWSNPATGEPTNVDPQKRQMLTLKTGVDGDGAPEIIYDFVEKNWVLRVHWENSDALLHEYCFAVVVDDTLIEDITLFHGNIVEVTHGRLSSTVFVDSDSEADQAMPRYTDTGRWGAVCRLPRGSRLAYQKVERGDSWRPSSTMRVWSVGSDVREYEEVITLVRSNESMDHFLVELDEEFEATVRFGNGVNGATLEAGAEVRCFYQTGRSLDGNVGADTLLGFDGTKFGAVDECWNPFDVTDGLEPESRAEVVRNAPEQYRSRQLRAITLDDYVERAQEVEGVSQAAARYVWAGSWRSVRVAIDPEGSTELSEDLVSAVSSHLEAVRLIGEDLEIRPPQYVPLQIDIEVCIDTDYWPEDVEHFLKQEFTTGYAPTGTKGFFHPDCWTFGQALRRSEVLGRAQSVEGVHHVESVTMARRVNPRSSEVEEIRVSAEEIILVQNNPDEMENGSISFTLRGGRR